MAAFAYIILQGCIIHLQGPDSKLAVAVGKDLKGRLSLALYAMAIPVALFVHPWLAAGIYALVALLWLAPDPRIESKLNQ